VTTMQGMERDALHKLETGAIPIGQDRSPFVIPMNPSREFLDLLFLKSFLSLNLFLLLSFLIKIQSRYIDPSTGRAFARV
jgi:hypothetical protein